MPDGERMQLGELSLSFLLAEKETLPLGTIAVPAEVESLTVTVHLTVVPGLTWLGDHVRITEEPLCVTVRLPGPALPEWSLSPA